MSTLHAVAQAAYPAVNHAESEWVDRPSGRSPKETVPLRTTANSTVLGRYTESDSLAVTFSNADGDRAEFSYQQTRELSVAFQISGSGTLKLMGDQADWDKIVDSIVVNYAEFKRSMIALFTDRIHDSGEESVDTVEKPSDASIPLEMPEYWNAENTAQRIVDFAVGFFDAYNGKGEDFVAMIRDAISAGFDQARSLLGALPDQVQSLIDDTYVSAMSKLDEWAQAKGISGDATESTGTDDSPIGNEAASAIVS